jgi:AmmeMemoRadiSam system protein A
LKNETPTAVYTLEEHAILLTIARDAIAQKLKIQSEKVPDRIPESLHRCLGAFVTLHCNGHLRGCIGYVQGIRPLDAAIRELALKAAFSDPRFAPLSAREYPSMEIEISVLGPLNPIASIEEIEIGKHGLMIEHRRATGLLLPQVAVEWGWNRQEFLEATAEKAGLPKNVLDDPRTVVLSFEAEVFSEDDVRNGRSV